MTELPEPMTPPECDLRGLAFMPLDVVRLLDSDLFALSNGAEFKAAVSLWCKAWMQVPAGSLPDDDRILAHLSGAAGSWRKVRAVALRGWVKCSDGRLYHRLICEKAESAWQFRKSQREKVRARWNPKNPTESTDEPIPRHDRGTAAEPAAVIQGRGTGTVQDSEAAPLAPARPARGRTHDARTLLWREGIPIVRALTGRSDKGARHAIGGWLHALGEDCPALLRILQDAESARPLDAMAWIAAAVKKPPQRASANGRLEAWDRIGTFLDGGNA